MWDFLQNRFSRRERRSSSTRQRSGSRSRSIRIEALEDRLLLAFDPSGVEQEVLFNLNRMRCNPQGELNVLFTSVSPLTARDSTVNNAIKYFNDPTTSEIQTDWPLLQPTAPLAWNASLDSASTAHSQLMIQDDLQSHQLPGEDPFYVRDANAGYTNESSGGENVDAYGVSGFNIHSAFAIDYGNGPTYGHRANMMSSAFREVGIAVVNDTRTGVQLGPQVVTEDFGARYNVGNPFLVGVVYNDANGNGRYDAGEGLSGVTITITGPAGTFTATTMTAGGYQVQVPAGTYQVTAAGGQLSGSHSVPVTVQGNNVEADFVSGVSRGYVNFSLVPAGPSSEIVGDAQPGFWSSSSATWSTSSQGLDGGSLVSSTANGSKQSQAAWWFSMPAGVYDLAITYAPGSNLTTKLGLDLYDGVGNWIGQIPVNEQSAPGDYVDQGVSWKRLGSVKLTNNIFHVSTWNSSGDGAMNIDAISLRAAPIVDDGDPADLVGSGTFALAGAWTPGSSGAYGDSHISSGTVGSGTSVATWTMPVTPGTYIVAATWPAATNLSTAIAYNIYDGTTKVGSGTVNQQAAPSGFTDAGQSWSTLSTVTITGSQLIVKLVNSAASGQVAADAIRIQPSYQPAEIVNNGYPGSWYGGSWSTISHGLFGDALVSSSANGSQQSQAAWWFPCRPGKYDIQVTWQAGSTYTQGLGLDVYNGPTWLKQVSVNERNAPSGATDQGVVWQSLGVFTVTGNVLHVSTWNSSTDGPICADGVRIVPIS